MSWSDWLALAMVCGLGAMSPGPSLAVVVRTTLASGGGAGVAASLAHAAGVGLYALGVALGLAVVVTESPIAFQALQYGGALFLAWLGIKALRSKGDGFSPETGGDGPQAGYWPGARDGFLIAFLNPKIAVWFIALFSQFVQPGAPLGTKIAMAGLAASIDGAWYALVALTISVGPVLRWLQARAIWLDRLFGILLLLVALRVAALAVTA